MFYRFDKSLFIHQTSNRNHTVQFQGSAVLAILLTAAVFFLGPRALRTLGEASDAGNANLPNEEAAVANVAEINKERVAEMDVKEEERKEVEKTEKWVNAKLKK